jgi:tRNA1(Val) A37 N6-methylase TrmN6
VLLAASVPVRNGERVLEAGTGAGAALLCLCARVPGVRAVGIELDHAVAAMAAANAAANRFDAIEIIAGSIETAMPAGRFDHALANPPYHAPGGTDSPVPARQTAKRGSDGLLWAWIGRLSSALRSRGSLTLIVPAGVVPACLAALSEAGSPCTSIFPLWPKSGRPAKLVLLRGIRQADAGPCAASAGWIVHARCSGNSQGRRRPGYRMRNRGSKSIGVRVPQVP